MIETKKEVKNVSYVTVYTAFDGTEFSQQSECERYENSAAGVLLAKAYEFSRRKYFYFKFDENDENKYILVIPETEEQIDILNQLSKLFGGSSEANDFSNEDLHKPILVGSRVCPNGTIDWVWFYNLTDIIEDTTEKLFTIVRKED